MLKKLNDFGLKYGNQKTQPKVQMGDQHDKKLEGLKESPKAEIDINSLKTTLRK